MIRRPAFARAALACASLLLVACSRAPSTNAAPATSSSTTAAIVDSSAEPVLAFGETPKWPAPSVTPENPIPMRVAKTES